LLILGGRMQRLCILLAFLFWGCGSYEEVNSFLARKCGNDYYNAETQFCQDAKIYDKCDGSSYDPFIEKCENNIMFSKCGNDYYDAAKQFCLDAKIYDKCGGYTYDPLNQKCENNIIFSKCGNDSYDAAKQFCLNAKIYDKCGGYIYDPLNQKCENNVVFSKCGDKWYNSYSEFCNGNNNVIETKGEFTDSRDGKVYKYVAIGTQLWMAENLRYETSNTKCYDNNPENCKIFGMLYDWNTAKTVCPSGWHLPNDTEWFTLRNFAGSDADSKLMASGIFESGTGTDDFGFTALLGGYYKGYFLTLEVQAVFWSATAGSMAGSAHSHHICPWSWVKEIEGLYINEGWVNVRCVM